MLHVCLGFPDGSAGKETACNAGDTGDAGSIPGLGRPPEEEMTTPPGFLPEKSHRQSSLMDYGPKGPKELDTTERLNTTLIRLMSQHSSLS